MQPGQIHLLLDSGYTNNYRIAGVRHSNDCDVWIVSHEWQTDAFHSYLITSSGISGPVISHTGMVYSTNLAPSCYKFSPDGKKLACSAADHWVQVFDFDRSTGMVGPNPIDFPFSDVYDGISFSPDNSKLYICMRGGNIYQYDMNAGSASAILSSQTVINPGPTDITWRAKLQIGPDKKIYVAWDGSIRREIGVITNPNAAGLACNYTDSVIILPNSTNDSFVNFIESYFYEPTTHVTYDSTGCANNILHFAVDSVKNATGYSWNMGDSVTVQGQNVTHSYHTDGTFTVKLTILFNCLAPVEITKTVVIKPVPVFTLPSDTFICQNSFIVLDCGAQADSYVWSTGDTTKSVLETSAGIYSVTANLAGCSSQQTITVKQREENGITSYSNVFTPNGDGKNDEFSLGDAVDIQKMIVYDRWGKKVFESNDQIKKWNGKINSSDASTGIYYYIVQTIDCNSQMRTVKGTVTLIR
ncbi:MAG: gliding motility-associated C-terminal domain-containing protein [Bacteroidetes bacterium]|nr:gliding motility-associated C-terminal domain-containing protein [Bacteroidota bacterium]